VGGKARRERGEPGENERQWETETSLPLVYSFCAGAVHERVRGQKEKDGQKEESERMRRQDQKRAWLGSLKRGLEQHRQRRQLEESDEREGVDDDEGRRGRVKMSDVVLGA
jgi:hypothetical protein